MNVTPLTHVELFFIEKKIEHWVRFGSAAHQQQIDSRRRILSFSPGTIFAFVRWASNDFGTVISRIAIVRAVARGEAYQTLPFVRPGGDILLNIGNWYKVERVLQAIDAIERLGIDPETVSPDHWRHIHNRLTAGQEPRAYTLAQHRAYLLRLRAEP
ncbi:MAG: glycosidase [Mesorhizobium sp. SCN 65-20]|nr:MAG: glycosidase [Mesorhizobium sp. SCN 65-20]